MASILDLVNLAMKGGEQMPQMLTQMPKFLQQWQQFLIELQKFFVHINSMLMKMDGRLDGIDSKLQTIIDGQLTVTPDIHEAATQWAAQDPRQSEYKGISLDQYQREARILDQFNDAHARGLNG